MNPDNVIPAERRDQVEKRDRRQCVRCNVPTMSGEWHHRRSRSVRDDHRHCSCNGIYLCGACHRWVHANPFEARELGYIVSRHKMPTIEPVFNIGPGWLLLDCEGGLTRITDPRD